MALRFKQPDAKDLERLALIREAQNAITATGAPLTPERRRFTHIAVDLAHPPVCWQTTTSANLECGKDYRGWRAAYGPIEIRWLRPGTRADELVRPTGGLARRSPNHIYVLPLLDEVALSAVAHEIGHCRDDRALDPIDEEVRAWRFAQRALPAWTQAMHADMRAALRSHINANSADGERRHLRAIYDAECTILADSDFAKTQKPWPMLSPVLVEKRELNLAHGPQLCRHTRHRFPPEAVTVRCETFFACEQCAINHDVDQASLRFRAERAQWDLEARRSTALFEAYKRTRSMAAARMTAEALR
jgi:hypothetical protein